MIIERVALYPNVLREVEQTARWLAPDNHVMVRQSLTRQLERLADAGAPDRVLLQALEDERALKE